MKKVPKVKLADRLHRGFVNVCIASTIFFGLNLVYMGYNYFVHVRPILKQEQLKQQEELLQEGIAFDRNAPNPL